MERQLQIGHLALALFLSFSLTCKLADIKPLHLANAQENLDLEIKAKKVINNPQYPKFLPGDWKKSKQLQFTIKDVWKSRIVRFFTPVKEPEQRMKVQINFEKDTMEIEFLNGPNAGQILGLSKREPYQIAPDTGKVFTGDNEVKLYLESLRFYILLVWNVQTYSTLQYAGESPRFGKNYDLIYASTKPGAATAETDQVLAYYEKSTGALEWVEFTYREVFPFYKGVLKLGSYEDWNGRLFPRKISILDSFEDSDFVHEIQIERIEINKAPLSEETQIQEQN